MAFGFRRLAIIDLDTGAQPLANEDGTIWQVFNGEIYNFRELRDFLQSKGHVFRSRSDSEVIVHAYEEWGPAFVERLKGMFAFALWDGRRQKLLLAVDRLGIKPLYYAHDGEQLVFASEAKALFASGLVPCAPNYTTLPFHMTFLTAPFPRTMFKGVEKLAPGHMLVFRDGQRLERTYWDHVPEQEAARWRERPFEKVAAAIERAVVGQSIADVPLGSFLSGGIDSSAVCEALSRHSANSIETYFIGFRPEDIKADVLMDERPYARQMADALGSLHHEIDVTSEGLEELLPKLIWHMDEPVGDPAAITTYLVSRAARNTLTVLLSGVGGDEIFAGYPRHLAMMLMGRFRQLPRPLRRTIEAAGGILPGGANALFRNTRKFLRSARADELSSYLQMLTYFSPAQHRELFTDDFFDAYCGEDVYAHHKAHYARAQDQPMLNRIQYVDLKTFLPCLNLAYTDRMSMAASIEVRVPLLDDDLVETMRSFPAALKIRGCTRKYAFKKAMETHLPREVIWRRKAGFGAPIQAWIGKELLAMVEELLGEEHLKRQGIFRPGFVRSMLDAQKRREDYYANHIWQLLTFQLWHRVFIETGYEAAPIAARVV